MFIGGPGPFGWIDGCFEQTEEERRAARRKENLGCLATCVVLLAAVSAVFVLGVLVGRLH